MYRASPAILLLAALTPPCLAQSSFYHVADVATDLSGSTFEPGEIVRYDDATASYSSVAVLPEGPPVDALHRLDNGDWLLSVAVSTDLGGATYSPRDVIRFDGVSYSLELDGDAAGIPAETNVDALLRDGAGDLIVGFDVATTIGVTTYDRNDLVRHSAGTFSTFFDASVAGVPATSDVLCADTSAAGVVVSFDVATDLSSTTFLPGELVEWDGLGFALLHGDPGWPLSSRKLGCSLDDAVAGPGAVPATLTMTRVSATVVNLAWTASCGASAADYGIYEGQMGSWTSHSMVDCLDDAGDLNEDVTPAAGNRYFLVVPHDTASIEGSYGMDSSDTERARGATTCHVTQTLGQCP